MLLREAGIDRHAEYVAWNVAPWCLGDGQRIKAAASSDISQGGAATEELLSLLPNVRVAVLFGKAAKRAWKRIGPALDAIEVRHPSSLNVNTCPEVRDEIRTALVEAKRLSAAGATG